MMGPINVSLVGYGYWGPNLARNIQLNPRTVLAHVADLDCGRLRAASNSFPHVALSEDPYDAIRDPATDAVIITTPVETHYALACAALSEQKHVLLSKPMTRTVREAEKLVSLAARNHVVLMIDHTFLFSGAVRAIKGLLVGGAIGSLNYFHSTRINLGLFRADVSVLWDLAPHDFSIMLYLLDEKPAEVSAIAAQPAAHLRYPMSSLAYVNFMFPSGLAAHVHVSWLSPVKVRQTIIGGSQKMIVYDDLDQNMPVKVFDKGVTPVDAEEAYNLLVQYRAGDMYAPKVEQREALGTLVREFVDAVERGGVPISDGAFGMQVVEMLEAADASIARQGASVAVAR